MKTDILNYVISLYTNSVLVDALGLVSIKYSVVCLGKRKHKHVTCDIYGVPYTRQMQMLRVFSEK